MNLLPERNTLKEDLKRDWQTFRSLHGKARLEFVFDYYKWPILVGIFCIFTLVTVVRIVYEGQKPYRLRICATLNTENDYSQIWFDEFIEELQSDGNKEAVDVNHDQPFDYDNDYYYLHEVEVMTTISSYRMDIAICNADMFEYLLALNACAPLDQILPEDLYTALSEEGVILYETAGAQIQEDGTVDTSDAVDGYFGLDLTNTDFAMTYDITEDDAPLYAVIISNTSHLDDCISLVQALYAE